MTKVKKIDLLPEGLIIGKFIRYYKDGWKTGTLEAFSKGTATIVPIGGYGAGKKHHVKVPEANVEPIEEVKGS